ncbi:hypothetical protein D5F01_LYC07038 [Larimichthys crocea]|uniref:Uncharacterized protein n=1 Tax=Larimichthys crocea TaxID=215358 RepID=A0A6G0IS39_LARCR|nr:hypothetical protein D5F01_LYC07038 [Larimichthys crocea]
MIERTVCFGTLQLKRWTIVGFDHLLFLLLFGTVFVGSWGEPQPWRETTSKSLEDQPLRQHSSTTVLLMPMQTPLDFNMTENNVIRRRRSSSSADTGDSGLPAKILTASHLSTLRYLVSDKKITVRLGLRVSLTGPSEILDPQHLLSLYKEPGIYNIGEKGPFVMKIVEIKKGDHCTLISSSTDQTSISWIIHEKTTALFLLDAHVTIAI